MDNSIKLCEHRHEVTFSFTVTGFGNTEAEAIEEARHYAINDWIKYNSVEGFNVVKVVKDIHSDMCSACEEE